MRLRTITFAALCLLANLAVAQNETDVLRYSQTFMKGSARFTAMGGAFGALGGDMSSFMINPAGVGIYRSSEFAFSTGVFNSNQKIDYDGYRTFDGHTSLNVGNAGIVMNFLKSNGESELKNFNFGISYNRVNDFNSNISLVGSEGVSSMMDVFKEGAAGLQKGDSKNPAAGTIEGNYRDLSISDWKHKLAWMNFLLDVDPADVNNPNADRYFASLDPNDKVQPFQYAEVRGFKDVVNLAFGTNVMDVVYLGTSLNITNVNYHSIYTYGESAAVGNVSDFDEFNFEQTLNSYGTGVSLSVGAILKPIQELRIGISYESPTWLRLDEDYSLWMNSFFKQGSHERGSESGIALTSYRINTPQRVTGSIATVLGGFFILSADIDWLNYDGMLMNSKSTSGYYNVIKAKKHDSEINGFIKDDFRNTINVRIGAEMKVDKFAVRAGFQSYKNPYMDGIVTDHPTIFYSLAGTTGGWNNKGGKGLNGATNVYSAGFGYRSRNFFIDFAYSLMNMKNSYSLYDQNYYDDKEKQDMNIYSGTATATTNRNSYIMTLGFKF